MTPLHLISVPYLIIKYFIIVHSKQLAAQFFFLLPEVTFIILCFWVTSSIWSASFKIKVTTVIFVKMIQAMTG
jgi:hypothetical protein